MTAHTDQSSIDLDCHRCGYNLRTLPPDGICPECEASVAESRRVAEVPLRPAWRDSDARWRRRVLAGVWALVLLPLMDALRMFGWASSVPVPSFFGPGDILTLDHTLASDPRVYPPLAFCIGMVLLFARERGRRRARLDWTRRWGVICTYITLLLSITHFLFIAALVLTGIAAIFLSIRSNYQPGVTQLFANVGRAYLRYGPDQTVNSVVVLGAFASAAVLLACVPLFDALRSSGSKRAAAIHLTPLAFFGLTHFAQAAGHLLRARSVTPIDADLLMTFFRPTLLVGYIARPAGGIGSGVTLGQFVVEAAKWCSVFAIALWLSVAQFRSRRRGG
jgi:hypothetical protein